MLLQREGRLTWRTEWSLVFPIGRCDVLRGPCSKVPWDYSKARAPLFLTKLLHLNGQPRSPYPSVQWPATRRHMSPEGDRCRGSGAAHAPLGFGQNSCCAVRSHWLFGSQTSRVFPKRKANDFQVVMRTNTSPRIRNQYPSYNEANCTKKKKKKKTQEEWRNHSM
jgi:hypothetical protein